MKTFAINQINLGGPVNPWPWIVPKAKTLCCGRCGQQFDGTLRARTRKEFQQRLTQSLVEFVNKHKDCEEPIVITA